MKYVSSDGKELKDSLSSWFYASSNSFPNCLVIPSIQAKMHPWKPDLRFPQFFSHLLIFYLLLSLPTVGFCLGALVLQIQRYGNLYDRDPCLAKEVVAVAVAFPTSIIALLHAAILLFLASRHRLTVKALLFSSLAMIIIWIPTLVIGWQPYNVYYKYGNDDGSARATRCYTVTGLLLQAEANYYYYAFQLTSRLQILMGVIIMTFSTL
jgi:hypothetical protein